YRSKDESTEEPGQIDAPRPPSPLSPSPPEGEEGRGEGVEVQSEVYMVRQHAWRKHPLTPTSSPFRGRGGSKETGNAPPRRARGGVSGRGPDAASRRPTG